MELLITNAIKLLKDNGYKNWRECEQASKQAKKRGSVSVPIAKQGTS